MNLSIATAAPLDAEPAEPSQEEIDRYIAQAIQEIPDEPVDTSGSSQVLRGRRRRASPYAQHRQERAFARLWLEERGIAYPGMPEPARDLVANPELPLLGQGDPLPLHNQKVVPRGPNRLVGERPGSAAGMALASPVNIDAEQAFLSVLLIEPTIADQVVGLVEPSHFFALANRIVFEEVRELVAAGVSLDVAILIDVLRSKGRLADVGGEAFVRALARKAGVKAESAQRYATIIRDDSRRRSMLRSIATVGDDLATGRITPDDAAVRIAKVADEMQATGDDVPEEFLPIWPVMAKEAFHGPLGRIITRMAPETEADPVAILVQFLACFSSMIGRKAHYGLNADRVFTNLYVAVIAPTGSGKGMSWRDTLWLLTPLDEDWVESCLKEGGLASGEGLVSEIRDWGITPDGEISPGCGDKRVCFVEEEYAVIAQVMSRQNNTLNGMLRKAFDGRTLRNRPKAGELQATDPHVSTIIQSTFEELVDVLGQRDRKNGFANRWLWTVARKCNELPFGGDFGGLKIGSDRDRLVKAIEFGSRAELAQKPFHFDEPAKVLWKSLYGRLSTRPGSLASVLARARTHVRKLAVLYAILDQSPTIGVDHLKAALAVWDYSERSAALIFGEGEPDPMADKVLKALRERPSTFRDLKRTLFQTKPTDEAQRFLEGMERSGLVTRKRVETGGRPTVMWSLPYKASFIDPLCQNAKRSSARSK